MAAKIYRFVVDADVARSAGESEHPVSSSARNFLDRIMNNDAVIVLCPKLSKEWRAHRSQYARKWLGSMTARKRVLRVDPNAEIMLKIEQHLKERDRGIAAKDAHVVDAAISSHGAIASNDTVARKVFGDSSTHFYPLRGLVWIVPREHAAFLDDIFCTNPVVPKECLLA